MRGVILRAPVALAAAMLLLAACAQEQANIVTDDQCAQGVRWQGLEANQRGLPDKQLQAMGEHRGAPEMHPGRDCIDCHKTLARGPAFAVAGTVFGERTEEADCAGVHGATVIITDAANVEHRLATNTLGNFMLRQDQASGFKTPYQVRLLYGGKERRMYTPQTNGSCNACHSVPTAKGGAPGRICVDPNDPVCTPL